MKQKIEHGKYNTKYISYEKIQQEENITQKNLFQKNPLFFLYLCLQVGGIFRFLG